MWQFLGDVLENVVLEGVGESINEIIEGVGDDVIMQELSNRNMAILLGMVYDLSTNKMDELIVRGAQNPVIRALGVVQENGSIDIDALYNAALAQMQAQGKVPIEVPLLGMFTFDENDLRELRQMIGG